MIDFHCHLDLYRQPSEIAEECARRQMYLLSVTTTPCAWQGTTALAKYSNRIRTALGLHPQLAAQRKHELSQFDELLPETRYVGEVGLDGGDEYKGTWDDQTAVFSHILRRCCDVGGRILSIHSRRATSSVLDHIEAHAGCGIPVMHWYSGTHKELDRAVKLGCWFSVGPAMLASRKGTECLLRMPRGRVLTETDGPFACHDNRPLQPWDVSLAIDAIAKHWKLATTQVEDELLSNLRTLTTHA